jgi:DNA polymerase-3 subunit epsilon
MRQIILDTETTGLKPEDGNRIIEIGCIEVLNRQATGNTFQRYLNPDRDIEDGAFRVHGLSRDFLSDKERFADIHDDFLHFVGNATIVIHNAPFDLAFLDAEFTRMDRKKKNPLKKNKIIDSLLIARKLHPGQRNSLDALAKRDMRSIAMIDRCMVLF